MKRDRVNDAIWSLNLIFRHWIIPKSRETSLLLLILK